MPEELPTYKVVADVIVSPTDTIVVGFEDETSYLHSIAPENEIATIGDINAIPQVDISSVDGDILPSQDNIYTLGNEDYRWKSIHIGEGTIYINDSVTNDVMALTIADGVFFIDGIAQAELANIRVTNLTFNDETVQTTAYTVPTEVDYVVGGGTISGTQPTFTGDPLFSGSYVKVGPLVHFRVNVEMTNITDFGTGQYYITLPFNSKYDVDLTGGHIEDVSKTNRWTLSGHVEAGSNQVYLTYTAGGQQEIFDHNSPFALSTSDFFSMAASYIAEDIA